MEIVDLNGGRKHVAVRETGDNSVTIEHDFPTWEKPKREEQRRDETRKIVEEGEEAYETMGGETFQKAAARSHAPGAKTAGKFEPVHSEGPKRSTADAARLNAELRKRQQMNADKEKSIRLAAYQHNEELAQRAKAFWNKSA